MTGLLNKTYCWAILLVDQKRGQEGDRNTVLSRPRGWGVTDRTEVHCFMSVEKTYWLKLHEKVCYDSLLQQKV